MAEPTVLYKIMILHLLSKAGFPLSHTQITDFFTEYRYTDYFTIQPVIHDLADSKMVDMEATTTTTLYSLTPEGDKTREAFLDRITPAIEDDMSKYLADNQLEMQQQNALTADYYKATDGGFMVHCVASENDKEMMEVTLRVANKEQAEAICYNWKLRYDEVYMNLMDSLIQ